MRVLVTGTNGQVARALAAAPKPDGVELVLLGRPALDLERLETLAPAVADIRPDVVLSVAAYTAVDAAEDHRETAYRVNAEAPGVLAEAARKHGAPVLHLSTDYVFDGTMSRPYLESDPTGPRTVYGASKLAGERAVAAAQPESLILRTAWVHAPWGSNFVRTMLRLAQTRNEVAVVSDQHGAPTYAPDIAATLLMLAGRALRREGPFGLFHMSGGGETTWAGFAQAVFEGSAARGGPTAQVRSIPTTSYPTPAARPLNSRLDGAALAQAWNVRLPHWRDGLARGLDQLLGATPMGDAA